MSVTVLLEIDFTAERFDDGIALFRSELMRTRAFPGCESVEVVVVDDNKHRVVFIERWSSAGDLDAYGRWRAGEGAITDLAEMVAKPPVLRRASPISL